MRCGLLAGSIVIIFAAMPLGAHHSLRAEYDVSKVVAMQGTVTKMEWTNPHARFSLDVVENGGTVSWEVELGAPNALNKAGWTRHTIQPGDRISADVSVAK